MNERYAIQWYVNFDWCVVSYDDFYCSALLDLIPGSHDNGNFNDCLCYTQSKRN